MHEAGGHPLADHPARGEGDLLQQGAGLRGHLRMVCGGVEFGDTIVDEFGHGGAVFQPGAALEGSESDMTVGQAHED